MSGRNGDVSFSVSRGDFEVIDAIARRAVGIAAKARIPYDLQDARMDVTACHANGTPLRLEALRDADDGNFAHDVFGIRRHLDRSTGKLGGCFCPRFAVPEHRERVS